MSERRLSHADIAKAKAKYPISKAVETLSLGAPSVLAKATGMIAGSCDSAPVSSYKRKGARGKSSYASTTHVRTAAQKRADALLFPRDQREAPELERYCFDGAVAALPLQRGGATGFLIRVRSFRRKLLDEDNLCEKYVVDCCRYAGLLPGDSPGQTKIEVSQQKVDPGAAEFIRIEIYQR